MIETNPEFGSRKSEEKNVNNEYQSWNVEVGILSMKGANDFGFRTAELKIGSLFEVGFLIFNRG